MSVKHTPGPWSVTPVAGGYRRKPYIVLRGNPPRHTLMARIEARFPDDANLIAAAPDMLEALRKIRDRQSDPNYIWDLADSAIAKAEGRP